MAEPTAASMRLEAVVSDWLECHTVTLAQALDDAGLSAFVEAAEVVANSTWPPSESDVIKLELALSALTGSKETSDG